MTEETENSVILPKTKLGQEDKRIRRGKTEGEEGKEGRNLDNVSELLSIYIFASVFHILTNQ